MKLEHTQHVLSLTDEELNYIYTGLVLLKADMQNGPNSVEAEFNKVDSMIVFLNQAVGYSGSPTI